MPNKELREKWPPLREKSKVREKTGHRKVKTTTVEKTREQKYPISDGGKKKGDPSPNPFANTGGNEKVKGVSHDAYVISEETLAGLRGGHTKKKRNPVLS